MLLKEWNPFCLWKHWTTGSVQIICTKFFKFQRRQL